MNRPQPSSQIQRPQPTLRVLGRLPYVAPPSDESTMVSEAESPTMGSPLFVTDSVKRGLIYGLVALTILAATWYFVSRKSGKTELAKNGDNTWEVQPPRPDAPEAPTWNPYGEAGPSVIQAAQAQNSSGPASSLTSSTPTVRSPLGFELPPGNGWGQPSSPDSAVSYPSDASGVVNSWQPNMGQSPASHQAQTSFDAIQGNVGAISPFPNPSALQPAGSAPVPPWANAAGQAPATQPAAYTAESYPAAASQNPVQPAMPGSPAVVRNPYVISETPATGNSFASPVNPAVYPAAPANVVSGAGSYSPAGTGPMNCGPATPNGWPTAASEQGAQQAEAYLASRPGNQWGTPSPSSTWQAGAAYPTAPQSPASGWDQTRSYGTIQPTSVGGNQAVSLPSGGYPSPTYPQGNWNLPSGQQPSGWNESSLVPPTAPAWNIPTGQPAQSPNYPTSPGSFSPVDRSNTLPNTSGDSQVVPATYARSTPTDVSMSQGSYPTSLYPSTNGPSNAVNTAPAQYPSTGQTGYGLYPATTLR
jgi:hypothetical protein